MPERERTDPPPVSPWGLISSLIRFDDREIIKKCGLDAYFFLRYLQTLLIIFIPIALIVIPILVPINYVGGVGQSILSNATDASKTSTSSDGQTITGLDTLAWGNLAPANQRRRWAHLVLALLVIVWVCFVFFSELKVYVKIRQDYLTSAEHRLRASANTVLVSEIPVKWYSEVALRGLFDVFPGGIRNIWLTRDFTVLLQKIHKREAIHKLLESAESDLIREAKRKQLKVRAAEEKKARRSHKTPGLSKTEQAQRDKQEDEEAKRRAAGQGGLTVGDHEEVPHDVSTAVDEADNEENQAGFASKVPILGGGLSKVGFGLKKGVAAVGGAGQGILGGAKAIGKGVDGELERTGGFEFIPDGRDSPSSAPPTRGSDQAGGTDRRRVQLVEDDEKPKQSFASESPLHTSTSRHAYSASAVSRESARDGGDGGGDGGVHHPPTFGNTTRKATDLDKMFITEQTKWWEFWKPPTGGYASPIPQGVEDDEYFKASDLEKPIWAKIKSALPFIGGDDVKPLDYPEAYSDDESHTKDEGAEWRKWVKESDRPHHRVALFDWTPGFLPGLPLINKKVDTIYWCRKELAKLNVEIEEDQKRPERYPEMNSAFIQFNNQVAAHMACQSVTHHVPKTMAPRIVEISPNDVIWDNMAIKWWDQWARKFIVFGIVVGMIILWAIPVAWTASLSNVDALIREYSWLGFLKANSTVHNVVKAIAGVLPAVVLAILLALAPIIIDLLAGFQGSKTGAQKSEVVQVYYFVFLFVQVFLVVSITGSTLQTLTSIGNDITSTPDLLAQNLPKAANYFFSYMILQALSTSSGTLLQIGTLVVWYVLSRILDNTARSKWTRNTELPNVRWGSFFPVYTNFACIALIYSVIAPLISIFAIITFSLLWVANRYNMLYVTRFRTDTGGVLYPRAINQTFTGLYVMELCLIGLFFLVRDENDNGVGYPQAIIMIVAMILTALFQYLMNSSFGPLLRYLPISFEDEAVLRDQAFQRAQARRLGLEPEDDETATLNNNVDTSSLNGTDVELRKLDKEGRTNTFNSTKLGKLNPVRGIVQAGTWAARGGKHIQARTFGKAEENLRNAAVYRQQQRQKDLEAQRAIGEALYGGYHDEIEDLTPEERDSLVRKAFQHYAMRARRPTVWIPRDDIGVSDDEIMRTRSFSEHIWISNEGTALDSKVRVLYGRNPPDFSEVDLINL